MSLAMIHFLEEDDHEVQKIEHKYEEPGYSAVQVVGTMHSVIRLSSALAEICKGTKYKITEVYKELEKKAEKMGLRVNIEKTKYIIVLASEEKRTSCDLQIEQKSLMLAGNEFQSLGMAIVKEDEYEKVRWDGIVSIVSWRERVFRLWWEERPHIDVSLTCEHDPKLQEYCVCPHNMPQFDSEGIPNQAPETNKPMILNGPTSRNREGSDQVSVEAKAIGPPLPIHRSGNLRSKYRRAVRLKRAGGPSCKK
ncbi:hypothetical protein ANN_04174 [Periplaneta americana]|uniref:Uncharacterized protein n=1 Tax=Periplaneta americana TaxID=6978 RepID=A0ABQ8T7U6_PERAM|nr:hypothetical protein ANN_04174 [Periplaneta americana]